jgi:uncharacterized protein YdeI (YjbR/CyaY-like superfamily)
MQSFKSSADFRQWLENNHAGSSGIWLRFFKKSSKEESLSYAQALDQALCFGWIDGQKKPFDAQSWLQRFTPRRPKSAWSKINTGHVARLTKAGTMTAAGLAAVAAAKADGRWQAAYASQRNAGPPDDFLKELGKNKKAKAFFETLNKANVYANGQEAGNAGAADGGHSRHDGAGQEISPMKKGSARNRSGHFLISDRFNR